MSKILARICTVHSTDWQANTAINDDNNTIKSVSQIINGCETWKLLIFNILGFYGKGNRCIDELENGVLLLRSGGIRQFPLHMSDSSDGYHSEFTYSWRSCSSSCVRATAIVAYTYLHTVIGTPCMSVEFWRTLPVGGTSIRWDYCPWKHMDSDHQGPYSLSSKELSHRSREISKSSDGAFMANLNRNLSNLTISKNWMKPYCAAGGKTSYTSYIEVKMQHVSFYYVMIYFCEVIVPGWTSRFSWQYQGILIEWNEISFTIHKSCYNFWFNKNNCQRFYVVFVPCPLKW